MFELLFKQTVTPVCVLKADQPTFTIVAFNAQFEKTTNTNVNSIIGKGVFDVYQPYNEAGRQSFLLLTNALNTCIESKQAVKLPVISFDICENEKSTSKKCYWQIDVKPVLDSHNQVEYLMCFTCDVTEHELDKIFVEQTLQREAQLVEKLKTVNEQLAAANDRLLHTVEELSLSQSNLQQLNTALEERVATRIKALAESEKRFKTILNAIPQIAWTNTPQGDVNFFNQRWYDYTGLDFEQSREWGWKAIIHPDDLQYNLDTYKAIITSNRRGEFEIREKRVDGAFRWHLVRIEPLANEDGEIELWIGTATDIHDLKELQQQKDDFISIASHELKTPLTTLTASLQLLYQLRETPAHAIVPKLIEQANKSLVKTNRLVEDLLNVSRLNQGGIQLKESTFVLADMLNKCFKDLQITDDFDLVVEGETAIPVYADEHHIGQVVTNLLDNAVKYAPDSAGIHLKVENTDHALKISVKDDGPGIAADKLPYLFNRYYRVNNSGAKHSGMGLGLYLCYEIIKRHEGQIGVISKPGKGSTFWFTLPVA